MDKAKKRHLEIYKSRGWFTFPLFGVVDGICGCRNSNCKSKGKHPLISGGFKNAQKNFFGFEKQVGKETFDHCNIGIATGKSNLVVIDVDGQKGGFETWEKYAPIQSGWKVLTGNGFHLYYMRPARDVGTIHCGTDVLGPGVDVRALGGYVVAPPSMHENGEAYQWVLDGTGELTSEIMADPQKHPPLLPSELTEPLALGGALRYRGSKANKKTAKDASQPPNLGSSPPNGYPSTPPRIQEAKNAISLLSVIQQDGVEIEYKGKTPFVKCPIHGESNASLKIDEEKQIWYCHGCQRGGDVITWLEEVRHLQKSEAIQQLYVLAGMEDYAIPKTRQEIDHKKLLSSDKKQQTQDNRATVPQKKRKKLLRERKPTEKLIRDHFKKYDFQWQEKEKLYSKRVDKLLSKSVLVERIPLHLQDFLIDNAEELAPKISKEGELIDAMRWEAVREWKRNARIVVADMLTKISPRPKGIIIAEELIQVETAIKRALSSEIKIRNDGDTITKNTSVLNQALETESQKWAQVADNVGAFIKAPGYIALRYDFLVQFFSPVLQGLSRKSFAHVLSMMQIAKSKPIRRKMRAYLIETDWLEDTFDISLFTDIKGDDMVEEDISELANLPKAWTGKKEDAECKIIEMETKAYLDENHYKH